MEASLSLMLAPMGCFSATATFGAMQRETQSYIKSSISFPGLAARKEIVRKVLTGRKTDKHLRAAVEVYFYRTARASQWHAQSDARKAELVDEFIDNVQRNAVGIKDVCGHESSSTHISGVNPGRSARKTP